MTKHTFLTLMLLSFLLPVQTQIENMIQPIEPALLECRYQWIQKTDTLGTEIAVDTMVLRIGKSVSQCYPQSTFSTDSLVNTPNGDEIFMQQVMNSFGKKGPKPGTKIINRYYYKNYPDGKFNTFAPIQIPVRIEENYQKQAWITVADSTKTVLGYSCQLAICQFQGREYKAWYTTEIPYQEGPWKFNGLPGLITEVYDTKNHYHFTLVSVRKEHLPPVCFYKLGVESLQEIPKKDRIAFLKESAKSNKHPFDFMETDYHNYK